MTKPWFFELNGVAIQYHEGVLQFDALTDGGPHCTIDRPAQAELVARVVRTAQRLDFENDRLKDALHALDYRVHLRTVEEIEVAWEKFLDRPSPAPPPEPSPGSGDAPTDPIPF